jgi:hypothetical protein
MQGVHPISVTHDHLGVIGGSLADTWCVASQLSVCGGHPGASDSRALARHRRPRASPASCWCCHSGVGERSRPGGFVERSVDITSDEMRWPYALYAERGGDKLEKRVHDRLARASEMTPAHYAELLAEKADMKAPAKPWALRTRSSR